MYTIFASQASEDGCTPKPKTVLPIFNRLWYTCALRYKILNPVYTRSYNSALDQPKFTRCTLMEHKLMQSSSLRFAPENVVAGTGTRQK